MAEFSHVTLRDCTVIEKLDGLVISATDWKVLNFDFHFELSNLNCKAETVYNTFKGLDFGVGPCKTFKLTLGHFNHLVVALVICVNQEVFLNFDVIGSELRRLQFQVVDDMNGSSTREDWKSKSENNQKKIVWMQDVYEFGNNFNQLATRFFNSYCGPVLDSRLVIAGFGHDCLFSQIQGILNRLNMNYVNQLVIHFAKDYLFANKALVWNRKALLELIGRKRLSKEYFVCLLKGVGNFYFNLQTSECADVINFIEAKFYCSVFKQMHRNNNLPFGSSKIAQDLFSPHQFALGFCRRYSRNWDKYLRQIQTVRRVLDDFSTTGSATARFEVIVKLQGEIDIQDVMFIPKVVELYPDLSSNQLTQCLRAISISDVWQHFKINLVPFVYNLHHHVNNRILKAKNQTLNVIDPGSFFSCIASAAIICFALYGNVYYRKGKEMYPNWLIQSLGIGRSDFKNADEFQIGKWLFPIIEQGSLSFRPLNKSVADIVRDVSLATGIPAEVYGPVCSLDEMLDGLDSGVVQMAEVKLGIRDVANTIIDCAITSALYSGKKRLLRRKIDELYFLIDKTEGPCEFKTTFEFVNELFADNQCLEALGFLRWIVNTIKYIIEGRDDLITRLKSKIRNLLELKLYNRPILLSIPIIHHQYKFWIIAPVAGAAGINFQSLTAESRDQLVYLMKRFLPSNVTSTAISRVLSIRWLPNDQFGAIMPMIVRQS